MLNASSCKGGRDRSVAVLPDVQRELLDRIHAFAGRDSLIRPDEKYVQQMGRFERDTRRAGVPKSHRLRHGYAQRRCRELAGFPCSAAGGNPVRAMTPEERRQEAFARRTIAAVFEGRSEWWRRGAMVATFHLKDDTTPDHPVTMTDWTCAGSRTREELPLWNPSLRKVFPVLEGKGVMFTIRMDFLLGMDDDVAYDIEVRRLSGDDPEVAKGWFRCISGRSRRAATVGAGARPN